MLFLFFTVHKTNILVVPDAYRHLNIPQFQQVVVDRKASIREIARDIRNGRMKLSGTKRFMLTLRRMDVLNGEDIKWVLEQLVDAVCVAGYDGKVIIAGPVPEVHDRPWLCQEMISAMEKIKDFTSKTDNFSAKPVGLALFDKSGVIPQLLNTHGLTLENCHPCCSKLVGFAGVNYSKSDQMYS